MLLKHWLAHTSTIAIVVPCLPASLWSDKDYDLSILPCKLFLHTTFLLSIVKQIELLALQSGQLLQDERPQLLLVQPHDLMMLIRQCLDKKAVPHHVNVNRLHTVSSNFMKLRICLITSTVQPFPSRRYCCVSDVDSIMPILKFNNATLDKFSGDN